MNLRKFKRPAKVVAGVASAQSPEVAARRLVKLDRELEKDKADTTFEQTFDLTGATLGDLLVYNGEKFVPASSILSLIITQSLLVATLQHVGSQAGFFGATPTTKPEVTGANDGIPALISLLSGLQTLGLVLDSSI